MKHRKLPLFYQHTIDEGTTLAVWKIEEPENFFLAKVPLQAAITHPHKRLQHLAGRYLLQYLFPDFPYEQILIADTYKPFLPDEQYHFSISHSGEFAAAIVSITRRVGIDIEVPSIKAARVQHKFLNEKEISGVQDSRFKVQGSRFKIQGSRFKVQDSRFRIQGSGFKVQDENKFITALWCAKETLFKWWGNGDVDYMNNLLLEDFNWADEGLINARILKNETNIPLTLQYKFFAENLCLCWVAACH